MIRRLVCALLAVLSIIVLSAMSTCAADHHMILKDRHVILDGKQAEIIYRSSGDLDGDGQKESVFSIIGTYAGGNYLWGILVGRYSGGKWQVVAFEETRVYEMRTDVTDINGDGKLEIIARGGTADGHGTCSIFALRDGKLREIANFGETRFRDLNHDGIPEVLSTGWTSFGFVGDHWLTIYKSNGSGYTDVSRRFPDAYGPVIQDIKRVIHELRYTDSYGSRHTPEESPDLFADLYYYLGLAFEYHGEPQKARIQYIIALRLVPDHNDAAVAIRRVK